MKEARFISINKEKWLKMEQGRQLDADRLAANFVELSDDLAYARTFYPGSDVEKYLNHLVASYLTDINVGRPAHTKNGGCFGGQIFRFCYLKNEKPWDLLLFSFYCPL